MLWHKEENICDTRSPKYGMERCIGAAQFERSGPDLAALAATSNISCPALISRYSAYVRTAQAREIECCSSKPQTELLAKLRLRTCDSERIRVDTVMESLHDRTIALIGDSTLHQLYDALVFDLRRASLPFSSILRDSERESQTGNFDEDQGCVAASGPRGKSKVGGSEVRFHFQWDTEPHCKVVGWTPKTQHFSKCRLLPDEELYLATTNTRLLWYRTNGNFTSKKQGHCGDQYHTFGGRLDAAIAASDTLLLSLGTWYNEDDPVATPAAYSSDVGYMFSRFASRQRMPAVPQW